jgi:hypothetical protein
LIIKPTVKQIYEQLNRSLAEKWAEGEIVRHNLEKGLGGERVIRSLLEDFLPIRYGVAKGKVINNAGELSRHSDVIIYDRINCPRLFADQNENQVIPIEGVYLVIEVKTTLTKKTLREAFENLRSVYDLEPERPVRSVNTLVDFRPPGLMVLGFRGLTLPTIRQHFQQMNELENVSASFSAFSVRSPGYKPDRPRYLVSDISCLGVGTIAHSLNGSISTIPYGEYTLGMLLTSLLADIEMIPSISVNILRYFNFDMIENPDDWFVNDVFEWL